MHFYNYNLFYLMLLRASSSLKCFKIAIFSSISAILIFLAWSSRWCCIASRSFINLSSLSSLMFWKSSWYYIVKVALILIIIINRERPVWPRSRLTTATHSSRCLKTFHCSSAVSGWWSIGTWSNGPHPY